jgi:hypothetical protein
MSASSVESPRWPTTRTCPGSTASTYYFGNPYGQRDRPRVNTWIEIERWHTWEAGGPMGVESESS